MGLAVSAGAVLAQQVQIQLPFGPAPATQNADPNGVYLPTDRTLSRGMVRAQERLAESEYNEALAFLQQILERDEDGFLDNVGQFDTRQGLKATARALIAGLPSEGREMYVLLHSASARRQLDVALAAADRESLAQIVRRYFLTPPGYEAAIVLAQMEFDRGHPLAAAHLYEQLLADTATAAQYEPQLSLLSAVTWVAASRPSDAARVLRALAESRPNAELELAGRKVRLPRSTSDSALLTWLNESIGIPQSIDASASDWLTPRGGPSRNATHRGGAPHLSARWQSRVVNDPRFESFLTSRSQQAEQQGIVTIPAARPIAAGNVVLMRTPQNVVAVDWHTGKRIWETREEESGARDRFLTEFMSGNGNDEWGPLGHPLEQRIWDDTLTMSLSSDGERVFALGGMSLQQRGDRAQWGVGPAFGGPFDFAAAPTNRLTAYELPTEGKLAWEIDGASASGELSGAFFLGSPLAVDGSLYVLAEIRSAVYLLALDPATGELQWRQQLMGLEQGITLDPQRRLNAATPSYSEGILVCPTMTGMLVAVDTIRREFAWVYRYPGQADSIVNVRQGWQGRVEAPIARNNNRWLDGTVLIADGKLFLTPPDSTELHCLELTTGKQLWKRPRDKALYLACVERGNLLLVGPDFVTALRVSDGAPAWPKEQSDLPPGATPSGLGYLSEGQYYLPVSSGQVLAINVDDGTIQRSAARTEATVGNLICHRGSVISQSALYLDKFEQIDVLRERAEAVLAANPRDAAAIRDLAEMKRLEGLLPEAVRMLKRAFEIDSGDPQTREMLADSLLEALADDFASFRADLPLLEEIVSRPQQQVELLRIDAAGRQAAGERREAFAVYLQLIDATAADPISLKIGSEYSVRSDPWIRARLNALWKEATPDERSEIVGELGARKQTWTSSPTTSEMRSYLSHFGGLPGTDEVRRQLIGALIEREGLLDAEIELLQLDQSPVEATRAEAVELRGRLLAAQGREQPSTDSGNAANPWPRGEVSVSDLPPSNARSTATRRAQAEFKTAMRSLRLEQLVGAEFGPAQWLIAQDNSRLVGRDALGTEVFRFSPSRSAAMRRFPGNSDLLQAAQLGDLLVLAVGGQVVALDTRDDDENEILWQANPTNQFPGAVPRSGRRGGRDIFHPWSQRKRVSGSAGILVTGLGPATPCGIVFQDPHRLRAVDPVSGETLWTRRDIPAGSELFGDSEFVLAANSAEEALFVIQMSDGSFVERRDLPEPPWLLTSGRNIVQLLDARHENEPRKSLRIVDAVSGSELFQAQYDPRVRMATVEPDSIVVVEPEGRLQLIDARTGKLRVDQHISLLAPVKGVYAVQSGDTLFVCVNGQPRQQSSRPIGLDYPLVDGHVYAIDLRDGSMMWPGPAVLEQRGIALGQPTGIPVLVFVDRLLKRDADGAGAKLRLLCLDRQTGAAVYRNDDLPDTSSVQQVRIRALRDDMPAVNIEMSTKTIRLAFSEQPRPPEPPANDLVEAPRKSLGRGLWGVGRRMGSALQDVIQDPLGRQWNFQVPNRPAGGIPKKRAEN